MALASGTEKSHLAQKFQELNMAHSCGVLIYTRDKFCLGLAKKLRPEFSKFFVSSEVKDCMKLIERFNKNSENIGIHLVSTIFLFPFLNSPHDIYLFVLWND